MESRNLDIIVESHRLANERRAQGMPAWDRYIDIRSIIHRDQTREDNEYVVCIANEIGKLLKSRLPGEYFDCTSDVYDWNFEEAIDALSEMTVAEFDDNEYRAVDEFNSWLSEVYDWADLNRIWLGS